jgi:hypothetical protein
MSYGSKRLRDDLTLVHGTTECVNRYLRSPTPDEEAKQQNTTPVLYLALPRASVAIIHHSPRLFPNQHLLEPAAPTDLQ